MRNTIRQFIYRSQDLTGNTIVVYGSLTITSYDTQSNLPEYIGIMGNFIGGLVLSPDGLNFQIPVTITIPLNDTITSGNEVRLFYYDDGDPDNSNYPANYSGWQQTDFTGTVSSDGQSVVAQIDHFSTYVIQMNFGENALDILGDMVETFGDNGLGVDFANYQTYFESTVAKLGDLHTYDLPGGFGYDCYKVVGIDYILYHNMGLLFENPLRNFQGTEGEIAFYYNYEGDRILPGGAQLIYHLFINVYIDRTPPAINLTAARTTVQTGEQTNITGCLSCGTDKMKNQDIDFSVNSLGSIHPTQQITNNNGDANITFTAGNVKGTATVTGEYSAHNKDQIEVISDGVNITIEEESEEPTIVNWSFQVVQNRDTIDPDGELISKKRTLINGTFKVDYSTDKVTGSAFGQETTTREAYSWDGEYNLGSLSGSCPYVEKTRSADYILEGYIRHDRTSISISISTEAEQHIDMWRHCVTANGTAEAKWLAWIPTTVNIRLPFEEGLTVIKEDPTKNYIYSWELNRN